MGWHHHDLTIAASAPLPNQIMCAYAFEDQNTQHVIYVAGKEPHVHELYWDNNGWHHNDLTVAANSALLPGAGQVSAYAFEDQGTQHVFYYPTTGSQIVELYWDNNGWHPNRYIALGAWPASADQIMSAYAFETQGTQHVIYTGQDFDIHELYWDNNGWHHNDLTEQAAAPQPDIAKNIYAYAFEGQGTQHVIYPGGDFHIHELYWDNNGWHHHDLTIAANAPLPSQIMCAYAFEGQGTQHVIYVGQDVHIRELYWDNNGWHHNDLTLATSAPLPGFTEPSVYQDMAAYAFEAQGTQHVIYVGQDFHIHELYWDNNGWHHHDLTIAANAPLPSVNQSICAYAFEDQGTQHVIYLGQDADIHELWWEPD